MSKMRELIADLERRRADAALMGGEARVARQHGRGKWDVRQRIEALFDAGTFLELGLHACDHQLDRKPAKHRAPGDGVLTGTGMIDGRMVAMAAYDFTILGGSIGETGEVKVTRLREMALRARIPIVWLIDSGGARISKDSGFKEQASMFAGTGHLFREQIHMSGVVPQVCAMVGPGAAGTAYIPGLADFVPMVKGTSSMALGGPYLVKAAVGEEIDEESLGGSKIHTRISGVADLEVKSDAACLQVVRDYLSYFPSHCDERPPVAPYDTPGGGGGLHPLHDGERLGDEVLDLLPEESRKLWDVRKLIEILVDEGSTLEIKPKWAPNLTCAFARMGGMPVGIVANNPRYLGGVLDVNSADKAARFVNVCDSFGIPLIFLMDVPGFVIGSHVEQQGIIRHGAKMLHSVASATVPKITVILRKAYGAGYYVMNGRAYEPDLIVAWPTAEISVMGAEGMVSIFARKMLAAVPEGPARDAAKQQMVDHISKGIDPYLAAGFALVDDIIDPRETRQVILHTLVRTKNKTVERPARKRPVLPV
jgi:acetyl-CoA carboxylase carboxyltransferase component